MNTANQKLYRILAIAGVGLAVCGLKIWMDASVPKSVIYSNHPQTDAVSSVLTDATQSLSLAIETLPTVAAAVPSFTVSIPIYLCGAVASPGIYQIKSGSYLYEVIETAGGLLPEAASEYINLVFCFSEAVSVYIPTRDEMQSFLDGKDNASSAYLRTGLIQGIWGTGDGNESSHSEGDQEPLQQSTTVNINTAQQRELETLPGVGEVTAKAIISYRETNGEFRSIEEIMK